ncbi:transcriptional regulator [Sporosarcina sp. NCCP-2716]|uniref:helix-turn-helix domain-containing protein n=1 Tax=Sporosarcina sp. NCCP-2716 TaxID=2943679 RepID=UPI002042381E|nr:helix-turn-helix transcriptional regulator [Sporosarcina sp. NCCP-2716]GKV69818.1 transcriptional regulator [Sporosarcina sp. NCCP-2716]
MPQDLSIMVRSELYKKKMSQRELAQMLGISSPYLSDIINGRKDGPKAQEHIKHIRKILNILEGREDVCSS